MDDHVLHRLQSITLDPLNATFQERILTNDLLYDIVFHAATPASLLCLSRTCRTARLAVQSYFHSAFNINNTLRRYFPDPLAFRSLQARTGALVSGSTALQFFNRLVYDESDLDVYVPLNSRKDVGRWILDQGYTFKPNSVQDADFEVAVLEEQPEMNPDVYYHMKGVSSVLTFSKPMPSDPSKELRVQVIVASRSPMEVILFFHSTVVFNVIAWDCAYSLYPRATFEDRTSLFLRRDEPRDSDVVQKYRSRGWRFVHELPTRRGQYTYPLFSPVPRWIADGRSWVLPLDTTGVTPPPPANSLSRAITRDPCYATCWQIDPQAQWHYRQRRLSQRQKVRLSGSCRIHDLPVGNGFGNSM